MVRGNLCIGCGSCVKVCSPKALSVHDGKVRLFTARCTVCGACVEACPAGASELAGRTVSEDDLAEELMRDVPFFRRSGGGITFSGGEPLNQAEACAETAVRLKNAYIHTALETTGFCAWDRFKELLLHVDLVLFDLKLMNPERHREITGVDNALILENAKRAASMKKLIFRVPLIPGFTGTEENLNEVARFVKDVHPGGTVHLLPYHSYGAGKYPGLNRSYEMDNAETQTPEELDAITSIFTRHGLDVVIM